MPSDRQILQERVAWGVRIHHIFTSNVYMLQKKKTKCMRSSKRLPSFIRLISAKLYEDQMHAFMLNNILLFL
jgi:hypothetical protein